MNKDIENICPLTYAMELISSKWRLPIIWALNQNKIMRYNELKRNVEGITNMMLSQCLKEMESVGMIIRKQYMEIPPRVEYSLTQEGESLIPALEALHKWGSNMKSINVKKIQKIY